MLPSPHSLLPSTILFFSQGCAPLSLFSTLLHLTMHLSEVEVHRMVDQSVGAWKTFGAPSTQALPRESRLLWLHADIAIGFGGLVTYNNDRGIFVNTLLTMCFLDREKILWILAQCSGPGLANSVCKFTRIHLPGSETSKVCLLGRIFFSCDFGLQSCEAILESLSRA